MLTAIFIDISKRIDLKVLDEELKNIPGIVDTGLFLSTTNLILMGKGEDVISFEKNS